MNVETNTLYTRFTTHNIQKSAQITFQMKADVLGITKTTKPQNRPFGSSFQFPLRFHLPVSQNSPIRLVLGFVGAGHI